MLLCAWASPEADICGAAAHAAFVAAAVNQRACGTAENATAAWATRSYAAVGRVAVATSAVRDSTAE